jgi:hypothetical protein
MSTIYQTIIVALLAAFIILFIGKTEIRIKLRDFNDKHGLYLIANMLDCDFCLSFWTCLFVTIGVSFIGYRPDLLVVLCATPITRYLL